VLWDMVGRDIPPRATKHHSGVEAVQVIEGEACYETPTRGFTLQKGVAVSECRFPCRRSNLFLGRWPAPGHRCCIARGFATGDM
jgi:hypothetical protein